MSHGLRHREAHDAAHVARGNAFGSQQVDEQSVDVGVVATSFSKRLDRAFHRAEVELETRLVLDELVGRARTVEVRGQFTNGIGNASAAVGEAGFVDGEARGRRWAFSGKRRRRQVELSERELLSAQDVFALGVRHRLEGAQARFDFG